MGKILGKNDILQANDIKTKEVEVPEWGGSVLVRGMTGQERDDFESSIVSREGKQTKMEMKDIRAKLVTKCIVGEDGKRLFDEKDVAALTRKSASALDRVFSVAQKLSGIGEEELKDLVKNSEPNQLDDSTSV